MVNVSQKDIDTQLIERIDLIIQEYLESPAPVATEKDIDDSLYYYFISRFESNISLLLDNNKSYRKNFDSAKETHYSAFENPRSYNRVRLNAVFNVVKALREDLSQGNLKSISEIIHADLFADFTEMAEHLLEEGYKDPAAVILGSVLEEHLRKLCIKNSLPIDAPDSKGVTKPKKADRLNTELTAAGVYEKLDQKSVTAWLGLRNKAAHGQYSDYLKPQVELLLQSVRDFITRHPA